jgi:flagellar biogenesis protein FliO
VKQKREFLRRSSGFLRRIKQWFSTRVHPWGARRQRQLRLCENLPLGERRFLSVVECGHQRFLVGGSVNSVAVLRELEGEATASPKNDDEDVPTYNLVDKGFPEYVRCS